MQKKQVKPIKLKGVKPEAMSQDEWIDLDELARSTIMLTLSKSVYFNVKEMKTSMSCRESYVIFMIKRVQLLKFTG